MMWGWDRRKSRKKILEALLQEKIWQGFPGKYKFISKISSAPMYLTHFQSNLNPFFPGTVSTKRKYTLLLSWVLKTEWVQMESMGSTHWVGPNWAKPQFKIQTNGYIPTKTVNKPCLKKNRKIAKFPLSSMHWHKTFRLVPWSLSTLLCRKCILSFAGDCRSVQTLIQSIIVWTCEIESSEVSLLFLAKSTQVPSQYFYHQNPGINLPFSPYDNKYDCLWGDDDECCNTWRKSNSKYARPLQPQCSFDFYLR